MTIANPETAADFESVQTLAAAPEDVLAALTAPEAVTGWWGPTSGATGEGGSFSVSFGSGRRIDLVVESASPRQVVWDVEAAPHTPEWARDDHRLRPGASRTGDRGAVPPLRADPAARVLRHVPLRLDALPGQPGGLRRPRGGRALPGGLTRSTSRVSNRMGP